MAGRDAPGSTTRAISGLRGDRVNPLRDPSDRRLPRVAGPCVLVMFGVTGDLSRKKLMPAVYDLANRGLLPPGFGLVGFARRDWEDEDFAKVVHDAVAERARTPFREEVWEQLLEGIRFVRGEFDDNDAFERLANTIRELDEERGTGGNHAFYLSIPPRSFETVISQLKRHGMTGHDSSHWSRVVIEKPFGHDLESARDLDEIISSAFSPESVFRIDHYLGKETVQNSWRSGSPTRSSSRFGITITFRTSRSPWQRILASLVGLVITTASEPPVMSSRTTYCNLWH